MALARGGQTLLSAAARDALGDALPDGARAREPRPLPAEGHRGAGRGLRARRARARRRSRRRPTPTRPTAWCAPATCGARCARSATTCPPSATPSSAARHELRALAARLDAGARLVTVLGPAAPARRASCAATAGRWLGDWPGGVYFCDLSRGAHARRHLCAPWPSALDVPLGSDDPARAARPRDRRPRPLPGHPRQLRAGRRARRRHRSAAGSTGRPRPRFVVTSRERLHLPGEEVLRARAAAARQRRDRAVRRRARGRSGPTSSLDDANRAAVGRGRAPARRPAAGDRAGRGARCACCRRRSCSSGCATASSCSPARAARPRARPRCARRSTGRGTCSRRGSRPRFAQCSVFEGGFTLEAAEAVLDLSRLARRAAGDRRRAGAGRQEPAAHLGARRARPLRHRRAVLRHVPQHPRVRRREARGERTGDGARPAEERHGRYFARFGTDEAIDALFRHGGVRRRRALALELDNLVAACRRAVVARRRGGGGRDLPRRLGSARAPGTLHLRASPWGREVLALPGVDAIAARRGAG